MQYYDVQKNWRKVKPHLTNPVVLDTLVMDFNKFTFGRWGKEFTPDKVPLDFESCDWFLDREKPGRMPAYWHYVKHSACHWLVNFNLELAQLAVPKHTWRIVSSQDHSTCWNGDDMLFDMNFMALGIPPDEAWELANHEIDHEVLEPNQHLSIAFAMHYSVDDERDPEKVDDNIHDRGKAWIMHLIQDGRDPMPWIQRNIDQLERLL